MKPFKLSSLLLPALLLGACESALACRPWGIQTGPSDLTYVSGRLINAHPDNPATAVCPMVRAPTPVGTANTGFGVYVDGVVHGEQWFVREGVLRHELPQVMTCTLYSHDYNGRWLGSVTESVTGPKSFTMTLKLPASQVPRYSSQAVQCEFPPAGWNWQAYSLETAAMITQYRIFVP